MKRGALLLAVIGIFFGAFASYQLLKTKTPEKTEAQEEVVKSEPEARPGEIENRAKEGGVKRAIELADRVAREHRELSPEEAVALRDYVFGPRPEEIDAGRWQHLVNACLNALRAQKPAPQGMGERLMEMAENNGDPVLRLYAMQHLSFWLDQETDERVRGEIVALLERLALKDGEETRGTALHVLSLRGEGADPGALQAACCDLVGDVKATHDVRITAIHTCADHGWKEALPELRKVAVDEGELLLVRAAAIFAIGKVGSAEDVELLKPLEKEPRLKIAVKEAVKKLE